MEATYTTDESVRSVAFQQKEKKSILNHYKVLIDLKKQDVFSLGDIQNLAFEGTSIIAFTRTYGDDSVAVVHNLADQSQILNTELLKGYNTLEWQEGKVERTESTIELQARGSVIYKKQ